MTTPRRAPMNVSSEILDQEQPAQPRHAGAERRAHDQLVLAAHAAHEREIGDVRGRDDHARMRRRP